MGQKTLTEGKAVGVMRRTILLLAVAALMAAMMVATAGPALAKKFPRDFDNCGANGGTFTTFPNSANGQGVKIHSCN